MRLIMIVRRIAALFLIRVALVGPLRIATGTGCFSAFVRLFDIVVIDGVMAVVGRAGSGVGFLLFAVLWLVIFVTMGIVAVRCLLVAFVFGFALVIIALVILVVAFVARAFVLAVMTVRAGVVVFVFLATIVTFGVFALAVMVLGRLMTTQSRPCMKGFRSMVSRGRQTGAETTANPSRYTGRRPPKRAG